MSWEKMVHKPNGKYVKLKVGFDNKIYLDGSETGYKVGGDNKIYTTAGTYVSNDNVENFCRSQGLIKWFSTNKKNSRFTWVFYLKFLSLRLLANTLTLLIAIAKLANIGFSSQNAAKGIHIELYKNAQNKFCLIVNKVFLDKIIEL